MSDVSIWVQSFLGLVAILGILIWLFFYSPKKSVIQEKIIKKKKSTPRVDDYRPLEALLEVIKNKKSSREELKEALDLVLKHHGTIHPKLGARTHPDFNIYGEIVFRICRHPNTDKDLIINFDKELEKRNEAYKRDINDFLTKGLNSRGF